MFCEGFCEAMFDCSFDSTSTDCTIYSPAWSQNISDQLPTILDEIYRPNCCKTKPLNTWSYNEIFNWICAEATNHDRNVQENQYHCLSDNNYINDTFCDIPLEDLVELSPVDKSREIIPRIPQIHDIAEANGVTASPLSHQQQLPSSIHNCSTSSGNERAVLEPPVRRKPGRPRSSLIIRKKPEKRMGKLWEFLRNLLLDNRTCPSLIKWDDYNQGCFKFVQSEKVAQLWGDRKKNDKMNYEKLSRAMRYYYRSQVLLPVEGKRLVYKFGPQATGWQTENPILL